MTLNQPLPLKDDGAAAHLPALPLPALTLSATDSTFVQLDKLPAGRSIIYLYPLTGGPDGAVPHGWDDIPGARGCTPEACAFRDHHAELLGAGASAVYGLSSQTTEYQKEAVERLHLPFAMLSDPQLQLARLLGLPTFTAAGVELYKRLTLVISNGVIEHVFYPVFPPGEHAGQVLEWLRNNPN